MGTSCPHLKHPCVKVKVYALIFHNRSPQLAKLAQVILSYSSWMVIVQSYQIVKVTQLIPLAAAWTKSRPLRIYPPLLLTM